MSDLIPLVIIGLVAGLFIGFVFWLRSSSIHVTASTPDGERAPWLGMKVARTAARRPFRRAILAA
jgi:hypothetical protein